MITRTLRKGFVSILGDPYTQSTKLPKKKEPFPRIIRGEFVENLAKAGPAD